MTEWINYKLKSLNGPRHCMAFAYMHRTARHDSSSDVRSCTEHCINANVTPKNGWCSPNALYNAFSPPTHFTACMRRDVLAVCTERLLREYLRVLKCRKRWKEQREHTIQPAHHLCGGAHIHSPCFLLHGYTNRFWTLFLLLFFLPKNGRACAFVWEGKSTCDDDEDDGGYEIAKITRTSALLWANKLWLLLQNALNRKY